MNTQTPTAGAAPTVPTVTIMTETGPRTIICEPVTEHFAITPGLVAVKDTAGQVTGYRLVSGFNVTHKPSGYAMPGQPACPPCCRLTAQLLEDIDVDWGAITKDNSRDTLRNLPADVRAELKYAWAVVDRCDMYECSEPGVEWPDRAEAATA